nr:hypothetical protein FFPRI1PSEUD_40130 [Pseudomonas sp. FFPRI_1]
MDNRTDVQRVIVAFLIIIVTLGGIAFVGCLMSPPGFFPSLRTALAIMALGVTCLLCYPLVFAYWMVSGRTRGMRDLLILHSVVSGALVTWYLVLIFG